MSRIDQALARARNGQAENLPPVAPAGVPMDLDYPVEAMPEAPARAAGDGPSAAVPVERSTPVERPATVGDAADLTSLPFPEKLVLSGGESAPVEQYRRLAARLLMAQAEKGTRIVMVTSAFPGEGKTLTAANLALTMSESYKRRVLLIDADLRRPWIHQLFGVPNASGLNDGLQDASTAKIPLLSVSDHLSILTAGRPDPDPMSVLSGDRMRRVLEEAGSRFEWVFIDTPPVAVLTDAHLLSSRVDAVLLVVESGKTPLPAIKTAIQTLGRERILGVVLNRVEGGLTPVAYDYYGERTVGRA